ncbi:MAG: ATP-binding protein [Pseudomonadota bacterium]
MAAAKHILTSAKFLDRRHEHVLLATMLIVLHLAINAGPGSPIGTSMMMAHLGLFFLWQPIWQRDQQLDFQGLVFVAILLGAMLFAGGWWATFGWLVALIGIVAGSSFSTRRESTVYQVTLAILVSELLVFCTPTLFLEHQLDRDIRQLFTIGLFAPPILLLLFPTQATLQPRDPFPVDVFRGITFALMTALMAIFSVLITYRFAFDYITSLVITLIALGGFLLLLSYIATPSSRNLGVRTLWERSILNIGTPFEAWLANIANLAGRQSSAEDFLRAAADELAALPWVSGVQWESGGLSEMSGDKGRFETTIRVGNLSATIFAERHFSSQLMLHSHLLVQVLNHFYNAKQREEEQAAEAHLKAVHETGARVTHDIKNLLQSMHGLTSALMSERPDDERRGSLTLLKRQLPRISQRLQVALDKLQSPGDDRIGDFQTIGDWWQTASEGISDPSVRFDADLQDPSIRIPRDLFDSALENALENARAKVRNDRARSIAINLVAQGERLELSVRDDGEAISAALTKRLFEKPVESADGLGIGLYQITRFADQLGYRFFLADNRDGEVCFKLVRESTPA